MWGYKTAKWENELGMSVLFDNADKFFLESIDMIGNSAKFTSSPLAGADGQATTDVQLEAKVIPCGFALFEPDGNDSVLTWLNGVFNPKVKGTLTVYTENNTYVIECRPQTVPTFRLEEIGCVWRWNVEFLADFPYWKVGTQKSVLLDSNAVVINSDCPFDIPPRIIFPAMSSDIVMQVNYRLRSTDSWSTAVDMFKVYGTLNGVTRDFPIRIDVRTLKIINTSTGANVNNWVDASAQTDKALIKYGQTQIVCTGVSSPPTLYYNDLSLGEL